MQESHEFVEMTEGSIISAFLGLVVKLSEATFRPMFLKVTTLLIWRRANVGTSAVIVDFQVVFRLCLKASASAKPFI